MRDREWELANGGRGYLYWQGAVPDFGELGLIWIVPIRARTRQLNIKFTSTGPCRLIRGAVANDPDFSDFFEVPVVVRHTWVPDAGDGVVIEEMPIAFESIVPIRETKS